MRDYNLKILIWLMFFGSLSFQSTVFADQPRDELVTALIKKESSNKDHPDGNDQAVGDRHLKQKAYGCLQIRQPAVDDVNRRYNTNYRAEDCLGDRALSIRICRLYIDMWATERRIGREPTDEDKARIWNGGPNGWKRSSTENYWLDLKNRFLKD